MICGLSQFFTFIHRKAKADILGFPSVGGSQDEWDAAQLAQNSCVERAWMLQVALTGQMGLADPLTASTPHWGLWKIFVLEIFATKENVSCNC